MREVTRNFFVGIASIIAIAGLAVLLMLFGELDRFLAERYEFTLLINSAAGLNRGSRVLLDGVQIGIVESVSVQEDSAFPVRVVSEIDESVRIPADVTPRIQQSLIGGTAMLSLTTQPHDAGPPRTFLPTDGSAQITGEFRGILEALTSQLDARMDSLVGAIENFEDLSETYRQVGENINDLVRPLTEEDIAAGNAVNLRTTAAKLDAAIDDARETLRLANEWLGDAELRDDSREVIAKANALLEKAAATVDRYAELPAALEADADQLLARMMPVADELSATLEEIRGVVALASSGRGTVAQLLSNPDLYNSLTDAAIRLERALVEAQLLIEKIKAEGLPIDL